MKTPPRIEMTSRRSRRGSALLLALTFLTIMALVAGATLSAISVRHKTAWRTAAWEESLVVADSGVDMVITQLSGLLPDIQLNAQTGASLASTSLSTPLQSLIPTVSGLSLANGVSITVANPELVHGGDGATTSRSTVTIDVLPLDQILTPNLGSSALSLLTSAPSTSVNLVRITSTGLVYLPGTRAAEINSMDATLLHAALQNDPRNGSPVSQPFVYRQVQALVKPIFPFQSGVLTGGGVNAPNSATVFDSYSSANALASTGSLYDSKKRRSNMTLGTDSPNFVVGGTVYGNVLTNGGDVVPSSQITGTINNSAFEALPDLNVPNWSGAATPVNGTATIAAGTLLAPTQHQYTQVNGTIHVTANPVSKLLGVVAPVPVVGALATSEADIYVSGNFTGSIVADVGVKVKLYVAGNVQMGPGALVNSTELASSLEILGVPGAPTPPTISIDTTGGVVAAIYAPDHAVTLAGNGDFSGAITAASLSIPANASVHFDEALALTPGPLLGYSLVSWSEITP